MSLWSSFTSAISNKIVKPVTSFGKDFLAGDLEPIIAAPKAGTEQELKSRVQAGLRSVNQFGINTAERSADLLLRTATELNNRVISPVITRPMSTLALLTDPDSPLYQKGQYDEGFQFKDIGTAYKRSAKVSTGQALTKSVLSPVGLYGGLANLTDDINLWDDENIQKNFSDNVVGKYFTGVTDLVVGGFGVSKAFGVAGKIGKSGLNHAGVSTRAKTVDEFKQDIQTGFDYADNIGGRQTVASTHMMQMAENKNLAEIEDLVQLYSNNERLAPIIAGTTKKEIVRDLILADKGDLEALGRLAQTNADDLFAMGNVAGQLQTKYLQTGNIFIPEGPAVDRLKAAFDQAVTKDARMVELRKTFFDESDQLRVLGKTDYFPVDPKFAGVTGLSDAYIKAESALRFGKSATKFDEYRYGSKQATAQLAEVLSLKIGNKVGGPIVNLIKFRNQVTGLKPLRYVTLSGMRPFDARVELTAFVDAIPTFKDGNKLINVTPTEVRKVADIRREWERAYVAAKDPIERYNVLEAIDEQVGFAVAWNNGWRTEAEISAVIKDIRSKVSTNKSAHEKVGYSFDANGQMNVTSPETTRQMANSYLFTPWDSIEREIILESSVGARRAFGTSKQVAKQIYEGLTRVWTFDALVCPMYIVKQSLLEPYISASLALGPMAAAKIGVTATANSFRNNIIQKPGGVASKLVNRKDLKAVNRRVTSNQRILNTLVAQKDHLSATIDDMLKAGSPAARQQNVPKLKKYLGAIDELVEKAELNLIESMAPLGKMPKINNAPSLRRRIDYIEKNLSPAELAKVQPQITAAKNGLSKYYAAVAKMATNGKVIKDIDDSLMKSYDEIDNVLDNTPNLLKEQAELFGKSAKYKQRYYGRTDNYRMFNGQWVPITSFFDDVDGNNFSKAVRAEVDNTITAEQTFLGELSVGTTQATINGRIPNLPIDISNPLYFQELQHVANDLIRGDKLFDILLSNPAEVTLKKWIASQEGIQYLAQWGVHGPADGLSYVKDKIAFLNRTIPSKEAQALILKREIKENELMDLLAPYAKDNKLFPIAPSDWNYAESAIFGNQAGSALTKILTKKSNDIYKKLNAPENPLREGVFDQLAMTNLTKKAQSLADQGVSVSQAQWNALRQAAGREALQETEKTFYTIRRQNTMLYAARAAVAFPAASLNAFYRYGRLAVNNPVRMTGFVYNYGRTFENFGVDKYGNPTDDINQIAWLVLPGSKDFGPLANKGEGVRLNAKSLGYLLNLPSPSFITSVSVAKIFKEWPTAEDYASGKKGPEWIKALLGAQYNRSFPYGPQDSLRKAFVPTWASALSNWATTPLGKDAFLSSVNSVYRYHKILFDMGIETKFVTEEQAIQEARGLWFSKFKNSFISPFGVPVDVNLYPASMIDGLYSKLTDKYQKQGMSRQEAQTAAGDELLTIVGPELTLENVTFKDYNKNIPGVVPTVENYNRIFSDNGDLVKQLASIKDGDISLVGLLGADIEYSSEDRNLSISRLLNDPNTKLPGTSKLINDSKLTPAEEDVQRQKNILWQRYNAMKDALTATITDGRSFRAHKELGDALQYAARTVFRAESQEWFDEYSSGLRGDNSYNYARAFNLIIKDPGFMNKHGQTEYWQDVNTFMNIRSQVAQVYNSFPDGDSRKSKFKDAYLDYIESNIVAFHPKLQTMLKIYFDNDTLKAVD
jgi:hypothetical protein